MKIHVYATLKDYFSSEFELATVAHNTDELKRHLVQLNDQAELLLNSCRFAVEEGFIDNDYKLKENDTVIIIPPASGG
ncbi:MoaD/ThiS family protein [Flavitalea sp. BT771]|uniref:MoaD/ThiS family protein n=1 Tax=Flavitalea sp. BT771 TaxID=3063329 RepID=UPI0026E19128|nr:MoaD/ThiS family protein [Flavitalea sp. BT771]MDO6431238.1 MoaD/ThiS family protein [Flavitalea sp. BT771]MDV6220145.1 MoaD/ThiS family protein [Flavitalea sp. BT771]